MLMNHADPHGQGIAGAAEVNRCSVEQNLTPVRAVESCQHVHQGAFAGTVFTEQGMNFARGDGQRDIVQGDDPGKGFADILDLQQIGHMD